MVIKLVMTKAYDKISWNFLTATMRKLGFSEDFINIIYRLVADVWYSILINGSRHGFFHSTRGLKQGDPLSPSLFVIAAEALSSSLNCLHEKEGYVGFSMSKKGPQVNHLCYADDIVIFSSCQKRSMNMIMKKLQQYEQASGQEISKEKSFFLTHTHTSQSIRDKIRVTSTTTFLSNILVVLYIVEGRRLVSLQTWLLDFCTKFRGGRVGYYPWEEGLH